METQPPANASTTNPNHTYLPTFAEWYNYQLSGLVATKRLQGELTAHLGYQKHDPAGTRVGMRGTALKLLYLGLLNASKKWSLVQGRSERGRRNRNLGGGPARVASRTRLLEGACDSAAASHEVVFPSRF